MNSNDKDMEIVNKLMPLVDKYLLADFKKQEAQRSKFSASKINEIREYDELKIQCNNQIMKILSDHRSPLVQTFLNDLYLNNKLKQ